MNNDHNISPLDVAVTRFLSQTDEATLKNRFQSEYADRIETLYHSFLAHETLSVIEQEKPGFLSTPVARLGLSSRALSALYDNRIETCEDLICLSVADLTKLRGAGSNVLQELAQKLDEFSKELSILEGCVKPEIM